MRIVSFLVPIWAMLALLRPGTRRSRPLLPPSSPLRAAPLSPVAGGGLGGSSGNGGNGGSSGGIGGAGQAGATAIKRSYGSVGATLNADYHVFRDDDEFDDDDGDDDGGYSFDDGHKSSFSGGHSLASGRSGGRT